MDQHSTPPPRWQTPGFLKLFWGDKLELFGHEFYDYQFSAIGVLLGSSILFCAVKSMSVYVKQRGMVRIRKCNMYEDDNDELDESTGQALIDLWYSTTFGEHELFNANKRRLRYDLWLLFR